MCDSIGLDHPVNLSGTDLIGTLPLLSLVNNTTQDLRGLFDEKFSWLAACESSFICWNSIALNINKTGGGCVQLRMVMLQAQNMVNPQGNAQRSPKDRAIVSNHRCTTEIKL